MEKSSDIKSKHDFKSDFAAAIKANSLLNGTFVGSPLEFAQFCNDQFFNEPNCYAVVRKLVSLIADWHGMESAVYLTLDTDSSGSPHKKSILKFQAVPQMPEPDVVGLRAALQVMITGDDDAKLGVYQTQTLGKDFYCVEFEEMDHQRGVLVWQSVRSLSEVKIATQSGSTDIRGEEIIEFLARSAQRAVHWLRRLDATQSLLYLDEVTGLYNYRYLDVALDSEMRRWSRFHLPFSLLFIDLDSFKQVNDIHGHMTGSGVLKQVGSQIRAAVRDVDIVIRYGGDEFVVVLIGTNSAQASQAAERVRKRVDQQLYKTDSGERVVKITTSIGVACCPDHGVDKATLLRLSDETMYEAKRNGKNRVVMVNRDVKQPIISPESMRRGRDSEISQEAPIDVLSLENELSGRSRK